jgi:cobalamin synthase
MYFALKVAISAVLIVVISELSKRSSFFGALVASLPLVSIIAMVWLWRETHDTARIAQFSTDVFWLVLPSLVLFLLLSPLLTRWHFSFPAALAIASTATVVAYLIASALFKRFGGDV